MTKRTYSLTENQIEWLENRANKMQIPISELMRRIIDEHIDNLESKEKN